MNRFHKMTPSPRLYKLPSGEGSKDERKAGLTEEHFANNILTFATNYTETRYCCILLVSRIFPEPRLVGKRNLGSEWRKEFKEDITEGTNPVNHCFHFGHLPPFHWQVLNLMFTLSLAAHGGLLPKGKGVGRERQSSTKISWKCPRVLPKVRILVTIMSNMVLATVDDDSACDTIDFQVNMFWAGVGTLRQLRRFWRIFIVNIHTQKYLMFCVLAKKSPNII